MDMEQASKEAGSRFSIFRATDAKPYSETSVMDYHQVTPIIADGIRRATDAGADEGQEVKLLFCMPGFSLTYAWFKSGFPLPRHTHDADCLYYILAGSLTLGTEELSVGDGFFVGSDVAYAYTPGAAGVEVLEFRTAEVFNIRFLANNRAFWDKAVKAVEDHRSGWAAESPPHMATV